MIGLKINHQPKTIEFMQYLSNFIVKKARKSKHKYGSFKKINNSDITNLKLVKLKYYKPYN
jgi:hypothetical protein